MQVTCAGADADQVPSVQVDVIVEGPDPSEAPNATNVPSVMLPVVLQVRLHDCRRGGKASMEEAVQGRQRIYAQSVKHHRATETNSEEGPGWHALVAHPA